MGANRQRARPTKTVIPKIPHMAMSRRNVPPCRSLNGGKHTERRSKRQCPGDGLSEGLFESEVEVHREMPCRFNLVLVDVLDASLRVPQSVFQGIAQVGGSRFLAL